MAPTKSKDALLSPAERAELEASVKKAEERIIHKRSDAEQHIKDHQALWEDRYECKITCVSRKGERNHVVYVGGPKHPDKPIRVNVKLEEWIREKHGGLPMFIIQKFMRSFDGEAAELKEDPSADGGVIHVVRQVPRFNVQLGKKVDLTKVEKKK